MTIETWVIGQTAIEIIIILLLMWFIKSHLAMRKKNSDLSSIFEKPEQILAEMRELTGQLDKNLEEKKEISKKMLGQLDEILKKADQSYNQLQGIIKEYSSKPVHSYNSELDSRRVRTSVNDLLKQGLSKQEIAQQLGISVGEIELLVKLQKRQIGNTVNNL
jgi:DNA-binding NarL/FixJ family response regulator